MNQTTPSPQIYGPGTFVDKSFLPVPEDARRVFEFIAGSTPAFNKDKRVWDTVSFEGRPDPMIPGPIKAPVVAAALHAMCGIVANELLEDRDGQPAHEQKVTVNTDHAGIWLGSVFAPHVNGSDVSELAKSGKLHSLFEKDLDRDVLATPMKLRTTSIYPTKTPNVWYQLHGSLNAPQLLESMGIDPHFPCKTPQEAYEYISKHVQTWSADELEMHNVKHGFCGSICYTPEGWLNTAMGKHLAQHPLVNYSRESYAIPTPPIPLHKTPSDHRPLAGIKVVEMVRIIAGPVIGNILAGFGADVIRVNCSRLIDLSVLTLSLNAGKRTIDLDITKEEDMARLNEFLEDADVFIQGFRPETLARKGLALKSLLEKAANRQKGIVYVEENAYGPDGPFSERPGWQQIGDAASGSSYVTGRSLNLPDGQSVLPPLPISDMTTGLVGALATMMALRDRSRHGGSYHVISSLVAADTIALHPEVGLYSPEVVQKNAETFQWGPMNSMQYVTEILMVVVEGWKKVFPEYLVPESPFMTTFEQTEPFGRVDLLKPVVRLGDEKASPQWLTGPVPSCYHDRNIQWL